MVLYKTNPKYDISGQKFGDWEAIEPVEDPRQGRHYRCICHGCGDLYNVARISLVKGRSIRCFSCARREMSRDKDMVGKQFGDWKVLEYAGKQHKSYSYLCRCKCGVIKKLHGPALRYGKTTKCIKCHNKELTSKQVTHGHSQTLVYKVWSSMKARCQDPGCRGYRWYGGRGIKLCERWQKFENFHSDMCPRPPGMEIDRIDNDGDYTPENCRWVTKEANLRNR